MVDNALACTRLFCISTLHVHMSDAKWLLQLALRSVGGLSEPSVVGVPFASKPIVYSLL